MFAGIDRVESAPDPPYAVAQSPLTLPMTHDIMESVVMDPPASG